MPLKARDSGGETEMTERVVDALTASEAPRPRRATVLHVPCQPARYAKLARNAAIGRWPNVTSRQVAIRHRENCDPIREPSARNPRAVRSALWHEA
jgi:hypothetical protein